MNKFFFAVLAVSAMAISTWATNIPLSNPSLESPSYNTGGAYPGWAGVNNWEVNFTGWSISGNRGAAPVAHAGIQGLWSCWGAGWCGLSQNSAYTVGAAGETLTAGVWAKTDANVGPGGVWFNLQLRLNGSQVSAAQPNYPAGTDWTNITTSYVTTAADIGKVVGISFGTDGGANAANANYCYMDDASLTTSASVSAPGITGTGASPNPVSLGGNVTLSVTVTNGTSPTISSVVVNASAIGGSSSLALVAAGGGVYTNTVTVTSATSYGSALLLPATSTDAYGFSGSTNISVTVNSPTLFTWSGGTGNWSAVNWMPNNLATPLYAGPTSTNAQAVVTNGTVTADIQGPGSIAAIKLNQGGVFTVRNWNGNNVYQSLGNLVFQGGTLDTADNSTYHAYGSSVLTAVTATGATNSTIASTGGGWFNLAYPSTTFTVSNGATLKVSASLTGSAGSPDTTYLASGLIKAGSGTLLLSGANQYSGSTVVSAGTLAVSSAATGAGAYSVADGATLGVNLTAAGATLKMSALTLGNSTLAFSNLSTTVSAITNTGALTLAGTTTVNVVGVPSPGTFLLVKFGSIGGSGGFVPGPLPSGYTGVISTNGNIITLAVSSAGPTVTNGMASPNPVNLGSSVTLSVTATPAGGSSVTNVVVNASGIGGSSSLALVAAGGGVFTNTLQVTSAPAYGSPLSLTVTATDNQGRVGYGNISVTVNSPTLFTWNGGTNNWTAINWMPNNLGTPLFAGPTLGSVQAVVTNGSVTVNVSGGVGGVGAINLAKTGVLLVNNSFYGSYGNLLFQGGSLDTADGSTYHAYGSSVLTAVTATGATNSTIANTGGGWYNLAYPSTTFTVSNGATLIVSATLTGSAGSPDTSYLASGLTKAGGGKLVLSGANQYSGGTVVAAGTLSISNTAALLAASSLTVSNGAVVNLGYAGTIPVASLVLGGVAQPGGTYGATGSGATFINNTYFTGTGVLNVVAVNQVLNWTGAVNNNWDASTANWTNSPGFNRWYDSLSAPNSAIFGATGVGTVTLAGPVVAQSLTFSNAGYTLTGGSLMLIGSRAITNNVNATIASPLDSSGLNKFGTGTLTLSASALYLGGLSVNVGAVTLTSPLLSGCTAVSIAAGAQMNLNFTGINVIGSLAINGTTLPVGTYNAQHPVYGSYFTGGGSLRTYPLTYQLSPGNENWPASIRAGIVTFMKEGVEAYNTNGYFPMFVWVNYDSSVGTANAGFYGPITFGAYRDTFVAIHELAHCLGCGTCYPAWGNNLSGGVWTGAHVNQRIQLFDGPSATVGGDGAHFWPYGLNYVSEDTSTGRYRHTKIVAAMRWDMGIVGDSNGDGVPDDWDMFWFGTPTQTSISASNDLAAYLADVSPLPTVSLVQTNLAYSVSGTNLTLTWPADHTGWTLLQQTNNLNLGFSANTNDWMRVPGSSATNRVVIPILPNTPAGFYRLVYP